MPHSPPGNCLHISTQHFQSDDKELRRLKRYSTVEEQLPTSFKHCCNTEASPQELQIRALKQAMSILSSHAQETRERVERLRTVLADRNAEPEVYVKLQRERWMEEKRQRAVDEETKVVLQHLELLNESSNHDTHVPYVPDPPALTAEARRDANLRKFLASTRTQAPIHTSRRASTSFEHTLRRRTMDRVTPMRLRSSLTTPAFVESIKGHPYYVSLEGAKLPWQPRSNGFASTASMFLSHDSAVLSAVAEYPNCNVDGTLPSESTSTDSDTLSHVPFFETHLSTPLTTPVIDTFRIPTPLTLNSEEDVQDQGGTATIFHTASYHPSEHIPANLHVSLPDYALELISHFDQSQVTTLKPIFPLSSISQPSLPHTSASSSRSAHSTSSFLQVPSSTPLGSGIRRRGSYRSLFSTPQDLLSCNGVEDRRGLGSSGGGFFSRPRQPVELSDPSTTTSLSLPATENVTKKVKKRWSVLWRQ
jgi:hypothetical protein